MLFSEIWKRKLENYKIVQNVSFRRKLTLEGARKTNAVNFRTEVAFLLKCLFLCYIMVEICLTGSDEAFTRLQIQVRDRENTQKINNFCQQCINVLLITELSFKFSEYS